MKRYYNQYSALGIAMNGNKVKSTNNQLYQYLIVNSIHKFNKPIGTTAHILLSYLISEQYSLQNSRMLTL